MVTRAPGFLGRRRGGERLAILAALAGWAIACNGILGIDEKQLVLLDGSTGDAGVLLDGSTGDAGAQAEAGAVPSPCTDQGNVCVPAPAGWSPPFYAYAGDASAPPSCTTALVLQAHAGLDASSAVCGTCSCGPATGADPCALDVLAYDGTSQDETVCSDTVCSRSYPVVASGGCMSTPGCTTNTGSISVVPPTDAGSCAPRSGATEVPDASWEQSAVGCAAAPLPSLGCANDATCVAAGTAPFGSAVCVSQDGDAMCPGAPFTARSVFYRSVADGRACSACTCGAPTWAGCQFSVEVFPSQNGTCSAEGGTPATYVSPGPCKWRSAFSDIIVTTDAAGAGGSCMPAGGGQPTGTATPADPVTVCCTL